VSGASGSRRCQHGFTTDRLSHLKLARQRFAAALLSFESVARPAPGANGYPELAKRCGLAGTVTLSVELDAQGVLQRSSVLSRQLSVPGIPAGTRPVVFETLLDDATQGRARSQTYKAPSDKQLKNGVMTASQALIWKQD
jgi:hypothetical protein